MPLNTWAPRRALTHGRTHLLTGRTYETRPALASPRRAVFSRIRASAKPGGSPGGEAVRGNRSGQETGEVLGECAPVLAPVVVVPADEDRPGVRMAPSRAPVERVAVARVAPGDQPARFRIRHMAVGHSRVPQVRQFPERLPDTPSEIALLARFRNVQRQEVVEDEGRVRLGQFDEIGRQCGTPLRRHVRPVDATSPLDTVVAQGRQRLFQSFEPQHVTWLPGRSPRGPHCLRTARGGTVPEGSFVGS